MKAKLVPFVILFLISFISVSQITIVQSDMAVIGDTISRQVDTLTTSTEGNSGANQTWDFSNAAAHVLNNTEIIAPSSTPYSADFPASNMAMTNDNIGFVYFDLTSPTMIIDGAAGDLLNNGVIIKAPFNPDLTLFQFPTTYGNNFTDTYGYDVITDGSSFSSLIDSIRLKHLGTVFDTVDGWGTTITPIGSYNTLRVKRVEYALDSIWTKAPDLGFPFPPPPWTFYDAFQDTDRFFSWLALEGKLAVAELNFDTLDNPNNLTWTLVPAIPVAQFTYTDNSGGSFSFNDQSTNTPTTWFWDFGDGFTSTLQNPVHQYTIDSSYTVCLTATNSSGSDSTCTVVVVSGANPNPPPIASFTFFDNGGGNVDFFDQSSNSPTSWSWTFGDMNTSTLKNPNHVYTIAGTTYNVCLTATNGFGSDTFCDSVFTASLVGIGNVTNDEFIKLYPNPSTGLIYVTSDQDGDYSLAIYNILGKVVHSEELVLRRGQHHQLNLAALSSGSYFYVLSDSKAARQSKGKISIFSH